MNGPNNAVTVVYTDDSDKALIIKAGTISLFLTLECEKHIKFNTASSEIYGVEINSKLLIDSVPIWNTSMPWSKFGCRKL